MKDALQSKVRFGDTDPSAFLGLHPIFGSDLPQAEPFVSAVREALASLYANGTRATLQRYSQR
jgi:mannitol-1-phosphate/altronate dehydrogenase